MSEMLDAISSHEPGAPSLGTTLLSLVVALNETTTSPEECADRVLRALEQGAVHLTGNFRSGGLER